MVALLGDFVTEPSVGGKHSAAKKAEPCAKVLARLQSRLGSFAVLGNHDAITNPNLIAEALTSHGISVLANSSHAIEQDGGRLWLLGTKDALESHCDLDATLAGIPQREPKILLAHEPDIAAGPAKLGIDVQFSGHSHGGQGRAPGFPPLYLPRWEANTMRVTTASEDCSYIRIEALGQWDFPFDFSALRKSRSSL